jgi:hypothetical protein
MGSIKATKDRPNLFIYFLKRYITGKIIITSELFDIEIVRPTKRIKLIILLFDIFNLLSKERQIRDTVKYEAKKPPSLHNPDIRARIDIE